MKEALSQNDIKYAYVDITDGMFFLKSFLKYRDNRSEFDEIKKSGSIGIPCTVVNDGEKIFFDMPPIEELR